MNEYILSETEQQLVEKYQQTNDNDIALYFFNKLGQEVISIIYSKLTLKFSSVPFEREDLASIVWKSLTKVLKLCKKNKLEIWQPWVSKSYCDTLRDIEKYFKNTELVLNYADSWDKFQEQHSVVRHPAELIDQPKQSFKDILEPIIEYVKANNKKDYTKTNIRKLLYLKSMGYTEREIAKKMHVSRRYITSMFKVILRISKRYLSASDR